MESNSGPKRDIVWRDQQDLEAKINQHVSYYDKSVSPNEGNTLIMINYVYNIVVD